MRKVLTGQILLILCCVFYLIWWYRGYRPGVQANKVGGVNGFLLLITVVFGVAGLTLSLMRIPEVAGAAGSSAQAGSPMQAATPLLNPTAIVIAGIAAYFILLVITRFGFHRIVTTELVLIVGWTTLEMTLINRLNAAGALSGGGFAAMCVVIAAAFLISMILYVAYYRMEEMKAFYAAMVPLITEAAAMAVLVVIEAAGSR